MLLRSRCPIGFSTSRETTCRSALLLTAGSGPLKQRRILRAQSTRPNSGNDKAADSSQTKSPPSGIKASFTSLFHVYSDPKCNSQLLALAVGQLLSSIATLIHDSYLPVYVQDVLGLSNTKIGAVQGMAQFLCQLSKGVSGVVGDVLGSQVRVLVFGTFLTLLCKPMFAMLSGVFHVFGLTACLYWFFFAKLMDRMSKGIREAPTKAVMNELARESGDSPDAAYGLRQSLATAGMLIGSTVATLTFALTRRNYVATFSVAAVPPLIALVWMVQNFKDEVFGHKVVAPEPPPPPTNHVTLGSVSVSMSSADEGAGDSNFAAAVAAAEGQPRQLVMPASFPSTSAAAGGAGGFGSSSSGISPSSAIVVPSGIPAPSSSRAAAPSTSNTTSSASSSSAPQLGLMGKAAALVGAFKPAYWQALVVVSVLYFARFDASFLSLRAKQVIDKAALPMLTLTNTLIQVVLTAPLAKLSGQSVAVRNRLLLAGFATMIAADACFGLQQLANPAGMFLGAALLGVHMALTHSITVSMVASYMPTGDVPGLGRISGTAVSFTDFLLGLSLAASNTIAGVLSDMTRSRGLGNVGCFAGGAAASLAAGALLLLFSRFGDLGRDDLVMKRGKKAKAA